MTKQEVEKLIADDAFKTAEDCEAAARLTARAYAGEMGRLATILALDKAAEEIEKKSAVADPLDNLLKELGVA